MRSDRKRKHLENWIVLKKMFYS